MSRTIAYACAGVFVVAALYVRFSSPGLTETQLLLRYWWLWLMAIPIAGLLLLTVPFLRRGRGG